MAVSIIDGTVESVELRRTGPGIILYKKIVFRLPSGETRTILKPISHANLGPHLAPGSSGRFYLFSAIDHRGVHGVRTSGGVAVQAHPKNNERIAVVLTILGPVMLLGFLFLLDRLSIWALILLILGPLLWVTNRKVRIEGERQFAADQGAAPAVVAPPAGAGNA